MRIQSKKAGSKFKVRIAGASGFVFRNSPNATASELKKVCPTKHPTLRITVEVWPHGQAETIVKKSSH